MEYTNLSEHSKLRISRAAFGCEPLGGTDWGTCDFPSIERAARAALDFGVNFFDTAAVYGLGESERNLSRALGPRIKDVVVSTKIGLRWKAPGNGERARIWRDARPESVRLAVEESLTRLGIERLPVVLIHWPDPETPIHETLEALSAIQQDGKIGEIGVSNFSPAMVREASQFGNLAIVQVQYSLLRREIESDLLPECRARNIGVMAWGVLAQGLLSGKYNLGSVFAANDRRGVHPNFRPEQRERAELINARLRECAERLGVHPAQVATRWVLDQPGVRAVCVGIKNIDQLRELAGATSISLPPEDFEGLSEGTQSAAEGRGVGHGEQGSRQ